MTILYVDDLIANLQNFRNVTGNVPVAFGSSTSTSNVNVEIEKAVVDRYGYIDPELLEAKNQMVAKMQDEYNELAKRLATFDEEWDKLSDEELDDVPLTQSQVRHALELRLQVMGSAITAIRRSDSIIRVG